MEVKSHYFIRHKLVVLSNSLLTGLIQSSLSLSVCVYTHARAKEQLLLLLLLKEDEEILRAKFILLFLIPIVFCVVTASTSFKEISFPPPDGEIER